MEREQWINMTFIHYLIFLSLNSLSHTSWIAFSLFYQASVHSKICYLLVELWFNGICVRIHTVNKIKNKTLRVVVTSFHLTLQQFSSLNHLLKPQEESKTKAIEKICSWRSLYSSMDVNWQAQRILTTSWFNSEKGRYCALSSTGVVPVRGFELLFFRSVEICHVWE